MKVTCGTDIIEIDRIKKAIEKNDKFIKDIFTESEIEYCESHKLQKYQHYAARFAAKEAIFKAVSNRVQKDKLNWRVFEVVGSDDGRPKVNYYIEIEGLEGIDISISHCREYAVANVIAIFSK